MTGNAEESLGRAEQLLARVQATREELEQVTKAEDSERALEILAELADLSRQVEEELQRAKREGEADAAGA